MPDHQLGVLDEDQVWAAIDDQRRRTADLLDGLTEDQWRHASLCDGWSVRDVAAHLTLQQLTLGDALVSLVRHPGSIGGINRTIRRSAQHRADAPVGELVAAIRAMTGARRHNVGVTSLETLTDILVHSQDIAVPLGLPLALDPSAAATAATRVWSYGGKGKARVFHTVPLGGYRLTATDLDWSVGAGPVVAGPIAALLLLLTGRRVVLPELTGDGSHTLRASLVPDSPRG